MSENTIVCRISKDNRGAWLQIIIRFPLLKIFDCVLDKDALKSMEGENNGSN